MSRGWSYVSIIDTIQSKVNIKQKICVVCFQVVDLLLSSNDTYEIDMCRHVDSISGLTPLTAAVTAGSLDLTKR